MPFTQSFLGISFWNGSTRELLEAADRDGGLFTVPSAPSLAMMREDPLLAEAYQSSDFAVVDGGYVALVLRFFFRRRLPRISGLQILQKLVGKAEHRIVPLQDRHVLWVVPSAAEKDRIDYYLEEKGFPGSHRHWYHAPLYQKDEDFQDVALAAAVEDLKPDWIILCIGGGKQEKLGRFLRSIASSASPDPSSPSQTGFRKNGPMILCTGGAIAFLTRGQAHIPTWADRLYLGWSFRVFQCPRSFFPRYWSAGYQLPLLLWEWRKRLFTDGAQ